MPTWDTIPVDGEKDADRRADGGGALREDDAGGEERRSEERGSEALGEGEEDRREKGCVYFIETADGGFVKIGYSIHVPRRFDEIGVLLPGLRLIGYMPGTMATERWLHGKFAALRERGEWFRHTEDLRGFITNLGLIEPPKPKPLPPPVMEQRKIRTMVTIPVKAREYFRKEGSRGGKKSAAARLTKMTRERRSEVARMAAAASARVRSAKAATKNAQ